MVIGTALPATEPTLTEQSEPVTSAADDAIKDYLRTRSRAARDRVIAENIGYVRAICSRIGTPANVKNVIEFEDLVGYGILGLMSALETYDPKLIYRKTGKPYTIRDYSFLRIRGYAQDAVRRLSHNSRTREVTCTPLDEAYSLSESDARYDVVNNSIPPKITANLKHAIDSLPLRQGAVMLFLVNGVSASAIATIFNMSSSRVLQDRDAAVVKLRTTLTESLGERTVIEALT